MEPLHPDIQKAINEKKSLMEVTRIMNIVDVHGSVANFDKLTEGLNENDKKQLENFTDIIVNYTKIKRLYDKYIKRK